jgi:hypothetical protein
MRTDYNKQARWSEPRESEQRAQLWETGPLVWEGLLPVATPGPGPKDSILLSLVGGEQT